MAERKRRIERERERERERRGEERQRGSREREEDTLPYFSRGSIVIFIDWIPRSQSRGLWHLYF